ncbi:MAG: hypothetical protein J6W40_01185 [Alphaproteobacteria bacterium]|nr:hypothetical protein [Alphaproteobacteria bacterium]
MRKVLPVVFACFIGIGVSYAAVRDASTISRGVANQNVSNARTTTKQVNTVSRTSAPQTVRVRDTKQATATRPTVARTATNTSRTATTRSNKNTTARTATSTTRARTATTKTTRASLLPTTNDSKTFGTGYNTCRDAYFTCMDQFCATQDETYRRCVCSSRLYDIKSKQRALNQTADQLQDFKDLNIEAIPKTAAEVHAMQNASEGEMVASFIKDKSESMAQLAGISAVLSSTKSKSLSTAGQLDIAGDINAIWATTDLTSGLNISNLTGETLYNAVHSQCVNLVADRCSSKSLLNMVVSAYSMYIENDCALILASLDKKKLSANASIRETEREMNAARLENYDAHNSSSINECIAKVRKDVTAEAACGSGYVHCLDTSGLYLNKTTGEPIYTSSFYQLGSTLSLSGDILKNDTNRTLILELNRKRMFAEDSLDTCRDLADEVWDEFVRQAVIEIYQSQQVKIRDVKNECLDVVNQCYDMQSNSLKDFSNVKEQLLLGSRLELSEELCIEKLAACSNLYGGGTDGMQELLTTMADITTQKIAQNCFATLQEYARDLCAVPSSDSLHSYPYACRVYAPGEQRHADTWGVCDNITAIDNQPMSRTASATAIYTRADEGSTSGGEQSTTPSSSSSHSSTSMCVTRYKTCDFKYYYMVDANGKIIFEYQLNANPDLAQPGNRCVQCSPTKGCPQPGENYDEDPTNVEFDNEPPCGDYSGSLYQKLVRYAVQACLRPSDIEILRSNTPDSGTKWNELKTTLLQDVNATLDLVKASMASVLKTECERVGGYWVSSPWTSNTERDTGIQLFSQFYNETGANTKWGYCADPATVALYYTGETTECTTNSDCGAGTCDSGTCQCFTNATKSNGVCTCNDGYSQQNDACVANSGTGGGSSGGGDSGGGDSGGGDSGSGG